MCVCIHTCACILKKDKVESLEVKYLPKITEDDMKLISQGKLSPVFFGTALVGFGVNQFLRHFLDMSPAPGARKTTTGEVEPTDKTFSGFI